MAHVRSVTPHPAAQTATSAAGTTDVSNVPALDAAGVERQLPAGAARDANRSGARARRASKLEAMRGGVRASIVTLTSALAIVAARAPSVSGARNPSLLFARPQADGAALLSATDPRGFIYVAGAADRDPSSGLLGPTSAFVTKLTPSGTPVYTTYLQASRFSGEYNDCGIEIHAIAVDRNGAAYVAGCTSAIDFPVVRPLVATLPDSRGDAFVAKVGPTGAFVYSTYFPAYNASAIAADDDGNAYVVGASGSRLPLVNAALTEGSGFAARLDATGSRLLYSTYLDATPSAVTIDRSGAAYVAGGADIYVTQSGRAPRCDPSGDASLIKLPPSGSRYDYAVCLGGSGFDVANGIAVDASGAAYVVGATASVDFPTVRPLDLPLHTGALWKTTDAGGTWTNLPLGEISAGQLVASAARPPTWFADGSFRSVDQGRTWQRLRQSFFRVAPDPRSAHTLYGTSFAGLFKSVDNGEQWSAIGAPPRSTLSWPIVLDPRDSRIVYAISNGAVEEALAKGDRPSLDRYRRFLEPILHRIGRAALGSANRAEGLLNGSIGPTQCR
jgi:hypothetical protein